MKTLFFSITAALFLFLHNLSAQDLILTNNGDSINCSITKIRNNTIYFTKPQKDAGSELQIPQDKVKRFEFGYFRNQDRPAQGLQNNANKNETKRGLSTALPKLSIGFFGGYTYRFAKISDAVPSFLKTYLEELKEGFHFGGNASYRIKDNIGAGLEYSYTTAHNELSGYFSKTNTTTNTTQNFYGSFVDVIDIQYIAPSVVYITKVSGNSNVLFNAGISLGYMWYHQTSGQPDGSHFIITGNTLGIGYSAGIDFKVSANLGLGLKLGFVLGSLSSYEIYNGVKTETYTLKESERESLSRVDMSIGLKFYN